MARLTSPTVYGQPDNNDAGWHNSAAKLPAAISAIKSPLSGHQSRSPRHARAARAGQHGWRYDVRATLYALFFTISADDDRAFHDFLEPILIRYATVDDGTRMRGAFIFGNSFHARTT